MNYIKDKSNTVKKQTTNSYVFRPMLFSTPMVQAILEGRKTQTRRIMKHQPPLGNYKFGINVTGTRCKENGLFHWIGIDEEIEYKVTDSKQPYFKCPFNKGDIIWVRETFAGADLKEETLKFYPEYKNPNFIYKAGSSYLNIKWKPSLFMPKKACRLFLEITDIRIERLNEISESDAEKEGINLVDYNCYENYLVEKDWIYQGSNQRNYHMFQDPIGSYASLWAKINGQKSWDYNPFVWVYDFKVVPKPIDILNII